MTTGSSPSTSSPSTSANNLATQTIQLEPSFTLPLALIALSVPVEFWHRWACLAIALFGLFLLVQAGTIRLKFAETTLEVYRQEKLIRSFPYQDWYNWEIYWQPVPILFYFREVKSIHFLPVLFNPRTLQVCLEARCPKGKSTEAQ